MSSEDHSNPSLAVDVIIRHKKRILLIERKNPPLGWAIPGGFVETGETVEEAARREIMEEIDLKLQNLTQWRVFSNPERDPRQHVVSVCFTASGNGQAIAGSDASNVQGFYLNNPLPDLVFDHEKILEQYHKDQFLPFLKNKRLTQQ